MIIVLFSPFFINNSLVNHKIMINKIRFDYFITKIEIWIILLIRWNQWIENDQNKLGKIFI